MEILILQGIYWVFSAIMDNEMETTALGLRI